MASCQHLNAFRSRRSAFVIVCLVLFAAIIILDYKLPFSMRFIVHSLVYIPEGFHSADLNEAKQFCEQQRPKRQILARRTLNIPPSSSVWDGVHTDRLKVIQGRVISRKAKKDNLTRPVGNAYDPPANATYRQLMKDLILAFDGIAKRHNMTYFLYGGSLIGSYRHHGMIPWDDDVDIAVHVKEQSLLKAALSRLPNTFKWGTTNNRWKLFYREIPDINKSIKWSYPFLDICFFDLSATKVYDVDAAWAKLGFRYNICDVFPLVDRPFWDMWLPAPRRTDVVLAATYDLDVCVSLSYSHSKEEYIPHWFSVDCNSLKAVYPFVERRTVNGTVYSEELKANNRLIHRIKVQT